MTGKEINNLLKLGVVQPYYFKDGTWYHQLALFPGAMIDRNGYIIFNTERDYLTKDGIAFGPAPNQVHIRPNGIQALAGYILFSEEQQDIIAEYLADKVFKKSGVPNNEKTLRKKRELDLLLRDKSLVKELKVMYDSKCQICELSISRHGKVGYCEVHHIRPLGTPHNGPDSLDNMICVCPNHHAELDFVVREIVEKKLSLRAHALAPEYLKYHNDLFFKYSTQKV